MKEPEIQNGEIFAKLVDIMSECGAVGKNSQMSGSGVSYKFRAADDVDAHVQPLLVKHGVVVIPLVCKVEASERVNPDDPRKVTSCILMTIDFRWFAMDGSYITARTVGYAYDQSDKAANKCMTAARKYNICQVLSIPTSDPKDQETENIQTGPRVSNQRSGGGYASRAEAEAAAEAKRKAAEQPLALPSGIVIGPAPGAPEAPPPEKKPAKPTKPSTPPAVASSTPVAAKPTATAAPTSARPEFGDQVKVLDAALKNGWTEDELQSWLGEFLVSAGCDCASEEGLVSTWTHEILDKAVSFVKANPAPPIDAEAA